MGGRGATTQTCVYQAQPKGALANFLLSHCMNFGEGGVAGELMAVETLYPMFESDLSVREDIKKFMVSSIFA